MKLRGIPCKYISASKPCVVTNAFLLVYSKHDINEVMLMTRTNQESVATFGEFL